MKKINLEYIKDRRIELRLNQVDIAKELNLNSAAAYMYYENGTYEFKANHLPVLAKVLKTDIKKFYTEI